MATRQRSSRRSITPRHVWLAALGAVSVAQKEASTAIAIARDEGQRLRRSAERAAVDTRDILRGVAMTAQERIEPTVLRFSADVEARLAPVLRKFGVAAPVARAPRKRRGAASHTASAAARSRAANPRRARTA